MKEVAVQMLLDGHRAVSVAKNLGLSGTSILYRWKAVQLALVAPPVTLGVKRKCRDHTEGSTGASSL